MGIVVRDLVVGASRFASCLATSTLSVMAYLSRLLFLVPQSKIFLPVLPVFTVYSCLAKKAPRYSRYFAKCKSFHQCSHVLPSRREHHIHESNSPCLLISTHVCTLDARILQTASLSTTLQTYISPYTVPPT